MFVDVCFPERCIELVAINNKTLRAMKFTPNEKLFSIQRNAADVSTLNIHCAD